MRVAFVLFIFVLAGCANQALEERQAYYQQLVGQPEEQLVRELGVPTRTLESNGTRFLAYVESRSETVHPSPPFAMTRYPRPGYPMYLLPNEIVERSCETTFEIAGGKVAGWRMHGNGCG